MQVQVEDVSTVKKVLHIEISEDKVTQELDEAYKELRKTAKIKGFRPGKVPRSILEGLYKKKGVCPTFCTKMFLNYASDNGDKKSVISSERYFIA